MKITSTAFENNQPIPEKYTCDGSDINPPLKFEETPFNAASLVLIVSDPDAPSKVFTHWLIYNMPPSTLQILENQVPPNSMQGITDFGKTGYGGPCPPSGTHRYFFKLYSLDVILNLLEGASKEEVQNAIEDHIIDQAELIGTYSKKGA